MCVLWDVYILPLNRDTPQIGHKEYCLSQSYCFPEMQL